MAAVLENIYDKFWGYGRYKIDNSNSPETQNVFPAYDITERIQKTPQRVNGIPVSYESSDLLGREIFLPIKLFISNELQINIDCCTIKVSSKKTIIKTELSERKGTVKRVFGISDYSFSIKGVLIGSNHQGGLRSFRLPAYEIEKLKDIYESMQPVQLQNALAELFNPRGFVIIENLEFPEVEGKSLKHRPFSLTCESDFINNLILE